MTGSFRYAYNVIGFGDEDVALSIDRLARLGYDAVEVEGEPERHPPSRIHKLAEDAGLTVSSVCPNFTEERDLSHPDPEIRSIAVAYLRNVAEFAAEVGAPLFIVAPTAYARVQPIADPLDEWLWAVEGIRTAGDHASSLDVDLTLECWNRYGTYMLNRLEEGTRMWHETSLANGGVMADTFHMNIEERSISGALLAYGNLLNHVHLSDSNRLAPGLGHIDFAQVLQALIEIGYERSLTFELIPMLPNLLEEGKESPSLDDVADQALHHMKQVEQMLTAGRLESS
jgi:sugar phosphate isomerase/epimerase